MNKKWTNDNRIHSPVCQASLRICGNKHAICVAWLAKNDSWTTNQGNGHPGHIKNRDACGKARQAANVGHHNGGPKNLGGSSENHRGSDTGAAKTWTRVNTRLRNTFQSSLDSSKPRWDRGAAALKTIANAGAQPIQMGRQAEYRGRKPRTRNFRIVQNVSSS